MAVRAEWTDYGRPAAERLRAEIARLKGGDPLSAVTVIVPSNHMGVATRRLLASGRLGPVTGYGPGMAAVTFLTVYRLAELVGAPSLAGSGRRPVSTPVIAAVLRSVLDAEPGRFAPVAAHPATEEALVGAYRELRDLPAPALDRLAGCGARAADVVRIHRATRARLEADWYDEEDLMTVATRVLAEDRTAGSPLAPTVVYLPQRLNLHAGRLLAAVGDRIPTLVLAGTTGDTRADTEVADATARLTTGDGRRPAAESTDASHGTDALTVAAPGTDAARTTIVTASDADEEVRTAVRTVVDAVRAGTPLGRMAILHTTREPYGRLIHDQLAAAGIDANGASVVPLAQRLAGRSLLQLFDWPAGGYRRWGLFAWLSGAPIRRHGRPVPASSWERLSRQAAVVAGRTDWDELLERLAVSLDDEAGRLAADPEQPAERAERAAADAVRARELREFVLGLIADLTTASCAPRTWATHAAWAKGQLGELLGGPSTRTAWPPVELKAAERVDEAIDRLAALEGIEGPVDLDVFTRTLRLVLDADLGRVGRLGEGVLVGSLAMGVGVELDLVVVVGLAEGSAPATIGEDPLLSEVERATTGGLLARGRDRIDRQHRELLAALAGAARQVLTVPRGDLRTSSMRVPSRWVLDVASAQVGRHCTSADLDRLGAPLVTSVASFDAGVRAAGFPATETEHRLQRLMAQAASGPTLIDDDDAVLGRAAEVIVARRSRRFTRFDGNLAGLDIPSPTTRPTSATRLEQWTACPFSHLLDNILGVDKVDDPDERLRLSPLDKGDLVHAVLEQFIGAHLGDPGEVWSEADHRELRAVAEARCDDYQAKGLTGRRLLWEGDRRSILADLDRVLAEDGARRRSTGWRPVAVELVFGLAGAPLEAVGLPLPDGRHVRFRGRADRVDVAPDGSLVVTDYKTGKADGYHKLTAGDPTRHGQRLQLPVYALAARALVDDPTRAVRADYWFATTRGAFKRVGYPVDDDVLAGTGALVAVIVAGIEAGVFPARPDPSTSNPHWGCPYCDPDGLGTGDLRRAWERKATDPALAAYVTMVEPGLLEEGLGNDAA
ncbi:MAG: PD-(D/E)XK nuclease family protein [Actinomycetota bacterium]|nr:PD-(D/E)XK nuclease family protein [Actinomycetota bacterium]